MSNKLAITVALLILTALISNVSAQTPAPVVDERTGNTYAIIGSSLILYDRSGAELTRFDHLRATPEQLLLNHHASRLYIRDANEVYALDAATLGEKGELRLDANPVRIDQSTSESSIYVGFDEQSVGVYDSVTGELVDWYSLSGTVRGIQIDPRRWSVIDNDRLEFYTIDGKAVSQEELKDAGSAGIFPPPVNLVAGPEFTLNESSGAKDFPSLDFDSSANFAATWTDLAGNDGSGEGVYIREFDGSGNSQGGEKGANSKRDQNQGNSTLGSSSSGDYVVIWRDDNGYDGDRFGVFFRRFSNGGAPKDNNEVKVANTTAGNQKEPSIDVEPDGDFVAAWTGPAGNDKAVFVRRFSANGNPKASEQIAGTSSNVFAPDIATNDSSRFAVVWRDETDDLARFRVFNGSGNPVNGVTKVDNSPNNQFAPTIGMDQNGNFVIAWQENAAGGIRYRLFDSNGNPLGNSRRASEVGDKDYSPSMSMAPDGKFCIAWRDDNSVAWARAFNSNGNPVAAEFQPSQSGGNQFAASCGIDAAGNFVVAWKYRPGSGAGAIRGRKFDSGNPPPGDLAVSCTANPITGNAPLAVNFTADATGGNGTYTYSWNFGDGTPASNQKNPSHTYNANGTFDAVVTVTSGTETANCRKTITVGGGGGGGVTVTEITETSGNRPTAEIIMSVKGTGFKQGATVSFNDPGINVFKTNFIDSKRIKIRIEILTTAFLGVHDVTVTNPDSTSGTGQDLFTVQQAGTYPPPVVSSLAPNAVAAGASKMVTISGLGFANDPNALSVRAGQGITVDSIQWISPQEIRARFTASNDAICGLRPVYAANGASESNPCNGCLNVTSSGLSLALTMPQSLRVGQQAAVVIKGAGFNASTQAKIRNTEKISQTFLDCGTIILTVRVPPGTAPGFKRVRVENASGEVAKRKDIFEIKP